MGKKPNTIRTTISVPRALKSRMDKVKEPVNWSALACQAFQDRLAEIAARKEKKTMDDVVDRLRASKRKGDSEHFQAGHKAGSEWARHSAEADELKRLESLSNQLLADWDRFFQTTGQDAYGVAERLYFALRPVDDGDRSEARDFWQMILGDDAEAEADSERPEFLHGFAEGAMEVWREVKEQL